MQTLSEWTHDWIKKVLPNTQAISLALLLALGFGLVIGLGKMLMPVFAAGVIAYLLEGIVKAGERRKLPRLAAVLVVYLLFLAFVLFLLVALLPLLYQQSMQFITQLPAWANSAQTLIMELPQRYPGFITETQLVEITATMRKDLLSWGQSMLTYSYSSLVSIITLTVYLILMPFLVFFFLKDKERILAWFIQYLPRDRHLSGKVWDEVDMQIGNYVRGKFIEVLALLIASLATFALMGLNYPLLLAVLIGLSAIIPYVGATLVTFPVVIVAFFQWGMGDEFWYLILAYSIIQALDAVVLIPLLFSEVVNLHPVAIIVAILFFGGIWGFWGVFFAIPLATLVKAVLNAWPRLGEEEDAGTATASPEIPAAMLKGPDAWVGRQRH
ncbi:AI-2E family transporter [Methylomagnum ishizawai]|uniref:AI-2E family transporter n=1 Tax=Methylomagnum ishizawai TaxID=1760988 RepID=UPI001C33650E|nr:AI-2E family transporter [Methylomagnum ishizawai]BBL75728.1 AI-2E family transporter [Methylomagnum ishizawai]